MRSRFRTMVFFLVFTVSVASQTDRLSAATYRIVESIEIDTVPSWFPVGFCLLTHGEQQYVAYYGEQHEMIVARRRLGDREWQKAVLPSRIGWVIASKRASAGVVGGAVLADNGHLDLARIL